MGPPSRQAGDTFLAWSKDARKRMNRLADTLETLKPFAETRSRAGLEMVRDWQLKPLEETIESQSSHVTLWGSPYTDVIAADRENVRESRALWTLIEARNAAAAKTRLDEFVRRNNARIMDWEGSIAAQLAAGLGIDVEKKGGVGIALPKIGLGSKIAIAVGLAVIVAITVPLLGRLASK